ncbi:MAG: M48 family metallopeptidase [Candidatus Kerfeldbacteria bacterium]|nr:M48 family metallopeptidase [Candidatus Kerfeldbacteria bacterium]
MANVYNRIQENKIKTAILISLFLAFIITLGYAYSILTDTPPQGIIFFAAMLSIIMSMVSYFAGDKIALASSRAHEVSKEANPYLYRIVENVSIAAGLPTPKVYVINDPAMNAFATGRNPKLASIAFTTGIIEGLENEELEAVAAHELSHVKNYDTRLMMIVAVLVGAITLIGDLVWHGHLFGGRRSSNREGGQAEAILAIVALVFLILSPIIAQLIQLAVSRKREYLADASAVLLTRYAQGLASALQKIGAQGTPMRNANGATAHLYFSNPFGSGSRFRNLWSTHPPIEKRIAALREMGNVK